MIILLVAAAMAVLLAGCGSSQREDQGSSQGSEQEGRSSPQTSEPTPSEMPVPITSETPEPTTNEALVGSCAVSGSTGGHQEQASGGEVSNGEIAFSRLLTDTNRDIYVVDGEGAHETRLTHTAQSSEWYPAWSPDGQKIAFIKYVPEKSVMRNNTLTIRKESSNLYAMNADGTNKTQLAEDVWTSPSWSPDGGKIVFTTGDQGDLSVINADGTHKISLITTSFAGNAENRTLFGRSVWSPTGNKIAFASRTLEEGYASSSSSASSPTPVEEGLTGIYLINVDGTGLCKLTTLSSTDGLFSLDWSLDGEQIAFYDMDKTEVINTDGSGREQLAKGAVAWSPDGQKLAFVNDSVLKVSNTDGSGVTPLAKGSSAVWSPDGEKLAFPCSAAHEAEGIDICVTNADGTELKRIALNIGSAGILTDVSWGRE